jgi:hypothetical protein
MERGIVISVALNPHEGARVSLKRCRAARDELRRWCRDDPGKLAVSSEWRAGMPVIAFRAPGPNGA